jgi:hypothetical protein
LIVMDESSTCEQTLLIKCPQNSNQCQPGIG